MTQALPRHGVGAPGGVRISSSAGRIQVVSAAIFNGDDDRCVRTLVRRLFLQAAVRLVKVDRARTCIDIRYDNAILDPHTALTIFSTALGSAGSDHPPGPLDDFLERVPGTVCRVERRRHGGNPRAAASWAMEQMLTKLSRFAGNGSPLRNGAASSRTGTTTTTLVGEEFICEYRIGASSVGAYSQARAPLDPSKRAMGSNGSRLHRLWRSQEHDPVADKRRKWIDNFVLVDVYRLGNLAAAGGCFVMAVVGAITPGIPTVPFVLATSYFLARSSPALNERLKRSKLFGQMLRDWEQHRALRSSTKMKTVALTLVIIGATAAVAQPSPVLLLLLIVMGGFGTYLVLRLPTLPKELPLLPAIA